MPPPRAATTAPPADEGRQVDLDTIAERHIQRVLREVGGNKSAAAKILGVNRRTLLRRGF